MARFDAFSELFDRYAEIVDSRYRPWLVRALAGGAGRGLDAGCGAGRYTTLLADHCETVLGVDVSAGMLEVARERRARPGITYQRRDLREVTAERDGRFDVVLAVAVVHHLPDPEAAVRHLAGLLAPGGRLLIVDMARPYDRWTRPRIYRQAIGEAARELVLRRSLADAATVLRLRLHPEWIAHVTASRAAPRPQVRERYERALPGAEIVDLYQSCGISWQAPAQGRDDSAKPE